MKSERPDSLGTQRQQVWPRPLLALPALVVLAAGCDLPGKPVPRKETPQFEDIYGKNCAGCHGTDGKLGPAPPLNDPIFRAAIPEDELMMTITSGRPKTPMPAFAKSEGGALTDTQIEILVCEIKGIPYRVVENNDGGAAKFKV